MADPITEASVFLYSGYEGYLPDATLVFSGTELGSLDKPVVLRRSGSNYLLVADGGQAGYVTVSDYDSYAEIMSGGTGRHLTITGYGSVAAHEGSLVSNVDIRPGSRLSLAGTGNDVSVAGVLSLGGSADAVAVLPGGVVRLSGKESSLSDVGSMAGQLDIAAGISRNVTVARGGHVYISGGTLDKAMFLEGSALDVLAGNPDGWTLSDVTFHKGAFARLYAGTILEGTIHLGISLNLQGVVDASGATVDFLLAERTDGDAAFIPDWEKCSTGKISLTVSERQSAGKYALADDASSFMASVALHCESFEAVYMDEDGRATCHDHVYALMLQGEDDTLFVDVSDYQTGASASGLSWADINGAKSYVLEMGDVQLEVASRGVDLLGLAKGDYGWRVRNAAEADNWQTGQAFSQTEEPKEPRKLEAATNDAADLFFARTDGVWNSGYMAKHVGNGAWAGTGETVELAGMLRVTDVFAGSEDASILKLSLPAEELAQGGAEDEAGNASRFRAVRPAPGAQATGVALFLDDIYSPMPESPAPGAKASGRLSRINTIIATEKADLIDLTSARFGCDDGMTVHGGAGNDILWGGGNGCRLFGDEGDDSLSGTAGNDILVGGSGNDVIQCLGGEDILCFGAEWGNDLVLQQAGGKATLWFAQGDERHWDAESMVYSDGANSVRIEGGVAAADITLKFGNDGSELYSLLLTQGAFLASMIS